MCTRTLERCTLTCCNAPDDADTGWHRKALAALTTLAAPACCRKDSDEYKLCCTITQTHIHKPLMHYRPPPFYTLPRFQPTCSTSPQGAGRKPGASFYTRKRLSLSLRSPSLSALHHSVIIEEPSASRGEGFEFVGEFALPPLREGHENKLASRSEHDSR
jgi:hypothetical protein